MKHGDRDGRTSNIRTRTICALGILPLLFDEATPLDQAISAGMVLDLVYISGALHGEYGSVGIKFAASDDSPIVLLPRQDLAVVGRIFPAVKDIAREMRTRLSAG